jgi:hypothetical protein
MRGDVIVHSAPRRGSVFALWLPAAVVASSEAGTGPANAPIATLAAPRTRGLAEIGDSLMHESESILDSFAARLRHEPLMPAAPSLRYSQLVDHVGAMLADIAAALVTLDESEGAPSALLADSADIQRFIADRHGLQRARLGWTQEALTREAAILREEIERSMRHCFTDVRRHEQLEVALGVVGRYLEEAEKASRRAMDRVAHQAKQRES